MKKFFSTIILVGIISVSINAQFISLKKGDELTFKQSRYSINHFVNDQLGLDNQNEQMSRQFISLKVIDEVRGGYKIVAECRYDFNYYRTKNEPEGNWQTSGYYESDLAKPGYKYPIYEYDVAFQLSKKGELSEVVVNQVNKESANMVTPDSTMVELFTKEVSDWFVCLTGNLKDDKNVTLNGNSFIVKEVSGEVATLVKEGEADSIHTAIQLKVDLSKGLLLEKKMFENYADKKVKGSNAISSSPGVASDGAISSTLINETKMIGVNKTPFSCAYYVNQTKVDTIFEETNVTIQGKIINPDSRREVGVRLFESLPNEFNRRTIVVPLKEDNTFEVRLKLNDLQVAEIIHKEMARVYLSPGDNIDVEVDLNHFDESIKVTGIGADNLNYCFKRFLFEEKENLCSRCLYDLSSKMTSESEADEFKDLFLNKLHQKQEFLNSNIKWLSPELYLAEYYDNLINCVNILNRFPDNHEYKRRQEGKTPLQINEDSYFSYQNIVHPDNDMMKFSNEYEHFIREYAFFYLGKKIDALSGKGNVVTGPDFYDQLYINRYALCNTLFSGTNQYILKYKTIEDALTRGSWKTANELYDKFNSDYPNASKTTILKEAFRKLSFVASGQPAFDFCLSDFEGNKVRLSDFKGKAVYIDFWSTYCGPCRASIERYGKEIHDRFKDEDVVFIYVALEYDLKRPKEFMEKNGIQGIQLIARGKEESLIREKYFFNGIPEYYIIDSNGLIVKRDAPRPYEIIQNPSILLDAIKIQSAKK